MFRSITPLSLDNKGRMAVPAKHRERLAELCAGQLIITIDRDRCLLIYPLPVWEDVERKLIQLSSTHRRARSLKRLLMGHAEECAMDAQGRILLPPPLREFAGLDKRVVLVGQGNKFELWDEQRWYQLREEWLEEGSDDDDDLPAELESLSF
ncbi:MAG TPA: division/cell wall cluster transcriptional repressor MraZ [Candidatus Competibacteraceae bacterium]|nr:division/cell wall cluster transcriptional repressor MraZ [Candidatus Competibacteraceae bacterium]